MSESKRFDPDSISVSAGETYRFLGSWRHSRDGSFGPLWHTAVGARNEVASFFDRRTNVMADKRLSDDAKKGDVKGVQCETLRGLGIRQRDLNRVLTGLDERRRALARVERADAGQAVTDAELARFYRSLTHDDRAQLHAGLVSGQEPEMIAAIMRMPRILFGMSPEVHASITSNAIARLHPEAVAEIQALSAAAQTCQSVLGRCVALVSPGLELKDRIVSLGADAWQVHVREGAPEAMEALANRYLAEAV